MDLTQLRARRIEVIKELTALEEMRRGSVVEQYQETTDRLGRTILRGPYPLYSYKEKGRTISRRLKTDIEVQTYRRQIENFRRFEELNRELIQLGERICQCSEAPGEKKGGNRPRSQPGSNAVGRTDRAGEGFRSGGRGSGPPDGGSRGGGQGVGIAPRRRRPGPAGRPGFQRLRRSDGKPGPGGKKHPHDLLSGPLRPLPVPMSGLRPNPLSRRRDPGCLRNDPFAGRPADDGPDRQPPNLQGSPGGLAALGRRRGQRQGRRAPGGKNGPGHRRMAGEGTRKAHGRSGRSLTPPNHSGPLYRDGWNRRTHDARRTGRPKRQAGRWNRQDPGSQDRLRYDQYRKQGLFVGAGVIEAGCKNIIGARLKQSGMEGSLAGANAIIALRCNILSGRFEDYWEERAA